MLAAQLVTPEHINFMARFARGLICLSLTEARSKQLNLSPMVTRNVSSMGANFYASIEAAEGVTTGISAADRSRTILAAVARDAGPRDVVSPGHVFPLMALNGGVLVRAGHTEASCDLAHLAGLTPAAVICEVLKEDGSIARLPDLLEFAREHQLKIGTIADLIRYRSQTEQLIERAAEREISTAYGSFKLIAYRDKSTQDTHLVLLKGEPQPEQETLVRVHEPLSLYDLLDASSQTHSWSVPAAMEAIAQAGNGVIILLRRDESGQQLVERIQHADERIRTRQDLRDYGIGSQILLDLNVRKMKLLATPRKMPSMGGFGLEITGYLEHTS